MERHFSAEVSHVILRRRNRALVDGRASRYWPGLFEWVWWALGAAVCLLLGYAGLALVPDDGLWWLWAPVIMWALAVFFMAATFHSFRDGAAMSRNGHLLTGTVTAVEKHQRPLFPGGILTEFTIDYRFLTPDGVELAAVLELTMPVRRPPSPGEHVAVLFLERLPRQGLGARAATRYLERHPIGSSGDVDTDIDALVTSTRIPGVTSRGIVAVM